MRVEHTARPVRRRRASGREVRNRLRGCLVDEGLLPHHVGAVFIHGADRPDTWVDIAETLPMKLAALREHRSQMGEWDPGEMITEWAREQGAPRRLAAAEAFRVMALSGD